ncbi:hypothetical protein JNG37_08245 [Streptococcus suis]|uniref:Uncharacterized protein n=1 Tax=Streptococcus suis TaxID=1307 RepID=A0A4T2GJT7_STRSU|nr:hypothetical protein [Streptococcus suis]MBM7270674.1 hypothetical protein [Streptococcus suis]TIH98160.1 hypothetical protein FAJ39_10250 [Streptococcus suis]
MNKRMKKKYELKNRVRTLETHIDFLIDQNNQLWNIVERNAQATNSRFDKLEKQVVKSNAKKPFWKR